MKHNFFAYFIYILYAVALGVGVHFLMTPIGGFLVIGFGWIGMPILMSLIPIIFIKKMFYMSLAPQVKNPFSLALHGSLKSIGLDVLFAISLAFFSSMVVMGAGDMPTFHVLGVAQTLDVVIFEVLSLIVLFAWLSRIVEYHLIWHRIADSARASFKGALFYANIAGFLLLTVCFFVWQIMLVHQIPDLI